MKVSDKGLAEILSHEAIVTSPYKDSVGVWTVGVGHTAGAGKPNPQTMDKGIETPIPDLIDLFRRDLAKFEDSVSAAVTVPLAQHEFDALVSFHFNTGAIARASFVKKLNAGDRLGAAAGMLEWKKPAEIIKRRTAEMKLFRDGKYSNDGKCSIYPANKFGAVQWGSGKRVGVASLIAQKGGDQSEVGIPTSEQNQQVKVVTATTSKMEAVQPTMLGSDPSTLRNDGAFTAPPSERSWWSSVLSRLFSKEP